MAATGVACSSQFPPPPLPFPPPCGPTPTVSRYGTNITTMAVVIAGALRRTMMAMAIASTPARASSAPVPATMRASVSSETGHTGMPVLRNTGVPTASARAAATAPTTKPTAAITTALAASSRPRRGAAVSETRISPRRYSPVMNIAATTTSGISPKNVPSSARWMEMTPGAPGRAGGGVIPGDRVAAAAQPQPARRGRGHAARQAGPVVDVVPLHPHAVGPGGHDRRVGGALRRVFLDDDPGLGPRLQAGSHLRLAVAPRADGDLAGQRRQLHRDRAVPGQRLVQEVERVLDRLTAAPGRRRRRAGARAGRTAGPTVHGAPGADVAEEEREGSNRQDRDKHSDHPAAYGTELGPLGMHQVPETVPLRGRRGAVRRHGSGRHDVAFPRYSTLSLVSSM